MEITLRCAETKRGIQLQKGGPPSNSLNLRVVKCRIMSRDPQESDDLKSYHVVSTYIPQRSIPQSGDKREGAEIGIGVGAVYVWAVYGLAFVVPLFWAVSGVVYSLGLVWLAERYRPKHLALGTLGLNPGWGILLFFAINDLPDMLHILRSDFAPGDDWRNIVVVVIPVVMFFWVEGSLLSLGLCPGIGVGSPDSHHDRPGQIIVGVVESAAASFVLLGMLFSSPSFEGLLASFWAIPIAGLSLVGLTWVLSRSRGRRVRIDWSQESKLDDNYAGGTTWERLGGWPGLIALAICLLALVLFNV